MGRLWGEMGYNRPMAVLGATDYSQKLVHARERYDSSLDKIRESYRKNIRDQKERQSDKIKGIKDRYESQLEQERRDLNRIRSEAKKNYAKQIEDVSDSYEKSLEELKSKVAKSRLENKKISAEKDQEVRDYIKNDIKERSDSLVRTYQRRYDDIKSQMNDNAIRADKENREKVGAVKEHYAKELTDVERKNVEKFEDVKKEYVREKDDAIERMRENFADNVEILRERIDKKRFLTESSLQNKIDESEHEKNRMMMFYEEQLEKLRKTSIKDFEGVSKLMDERRDMEQKSFARKMAERERLFKREVGELVRGFNKKIVMEKIASKRRMGEMANKYENKILEQRQSFQKELSQKIDILKQEYERMIEKLTFERMSLIAQYEAKIERAQRNRA